MSSVGRYDKKYLYKVRERSELTRGAGENGGRAMLFWNCKN